MRKLLRERLAVLLTIAMVVTGIPMPAYAGTVSLQAAQQYQLGTWVYSTADAINYSFTPEESGEYVVWLMNKADDRENGKLHVTGNNEDYRAYVYFEIFDVDVVELSLEKGNTYTMEYESESSTDKNEMGFLIKKSTQSNIVMDQKQSITGEEFGCYSFQCSVAESGIYAVNFEFLAEESGFIQFNVNGKGISTKIRKWNEVLYLSWEEGAPLDVRIFSKNAGNISVEVQKINIVEMTGSTMTNLSYDPNAAPTLYHVALDENSRYDIVSTGTGSGRSGIQLLKSDFWDYQSSYAYDSWNMAMSCRIGAESDEEEDTIGETNGDGKIDYYILFNGDQAAQNLTLSVNKVSVNKEIVADTPLTDTIDTFAPRYYSFTPATAGKYMIGGTLEGSAYVTIYDEQWNSLQSSFVSSGSQLTFEAEEGQTLYIRVLCEEIQADPVQILLEKSNWDYEIADGVLTISGSGRLSGDRGMFSEIDSSIHKIVIGDGITSVENGIFAWLDKVTEVSLPSTLTSIGDFAFSGLGLREITIPDTVTSIGNGAFRFNDNLEKVTIGKGVTTIGRNAFAYDSKLKSITVHSDNQTYKSKDNVLFTKDEKRLVMYPAGLESSSYTVPETVTAIEEGAFRGNSAITSITLGKIVSSLADRDYALHDLLGLQSIQVEAGNTTYSARDGVLFSADGSRLIEYPSEKNGEAYTVGTGVTSIAYSAFWGNMNIKTVAIPTSVQSIEEAAFSVTGLTSVVIPEGVATISERSFMWCQNLETVTIPVSVTAVGTYAFLGNDKLTTVYYNGTDAQWNNIRIEEGNDKLTDAKRLQNIAAPEGNPSQNPGGNNTQNTGGNVTQNPGGNPSQNSGTTVTQNPGGNTTQNSSANTSTSKSKTKSKQKLKVKSGTKVNYTKKKLKKAKKKFTIKLSGAKGKVTYTSNKKKYVTVNSKGVVTVKKGTPKGTYKVTVKAAGNSKYKAASATITIKVK